MMAATAVTAAEQSKPSQTSPTLAGLVTIAPYADVSAKVTSFGMLIGNPVVPALLLASLQQSAVVTYGRFRSDMPVYLVSYMVGQGKNDEAVVYPSVDRVARMALANPGSERIAKDALHLMPTDRHPHDRYAVFAKDNIFTSFASSEALARQALVDAQPAAKDSFPLVRVALQRQGIRAVCQAANKSGATNVSDIVEGFARLDLVMEMDTRGLSLSFTGVRNDGVADAACKARIERELQGLFGMIGGGNEKLAPSVTVSTKPGGIVTGEVLLAEDQLKGLGKDFNSFVAKQMSGALSGEKENKDQGNKNKKGAKGKVQKK